MHTSKNKAFFSSESKEKPHPFLVSSGTPLKLLNRPPSHSQKVTLTMTMIRQIYMARFKNLDDVKNNTPLPTLTVRVDLRPIPILDGLAKVLAFKSEIQTHLTRMIAKATVT
jgi:hypothetical protein